jgi:hypothetical protein
MLDRYVHIPHNLQGGGGSESNSSKCDARTCFFSALADQAPPWVPPLLPRGHWEIRRIKRNLWTYTRLFKGSGLMATSLETTSHLQPQNIFRVAVISSLSLAHRTLLSLPIPPQVGRAFLLTRSMVRCWQRQRRCHPNNWPRQRHVL